MIYNMRPNNNGKVRMTKCDFQFGVKIYYGPSRGISFYLDVILLFSPVEINGQE